MRGRVIAGVFMLTVVICLAAPAGHAEIIAEQSRPWRVGVAGGWTLGYVGVLAHHGMPVERILEPEVLELESLSKYDCVIVGARSNHSQQAWEVMEEYIRQGGTAVTEAFPIPSEAALPGKRLKHGRVPNVRFVNAVDPITRGLNYEAIIHTMRRHGCSIIPDEDSGTTVIARYTYEEIPAKWRDKIDDHFVEKKTDKDGNVREIGAPAILMRHVGKGILVYSGCPIGLSLSLRGDEFAPLLINLLRYLSKGEIHERFYTGDISRSRLLTANLRQFEPQATLPPMPESSSLPEDWTDLGAETAAGESFFVYGDLKGPQAGVIFDWIDPQNHRRVVLDGKHIQVLDIADGTEQHLGSATLTRGPTAGDELMIRRHGQAVICSINGEPVLYGCAANDRGGSLAVQGLEEAGYQPVAPVYFSDDFMREKGASGEWKTLSGTWEAVEVKGRADMGANPFQYTGRSDARAVATAGHWFWQDYRFSASVSPSADSAGLVFNMQDPDNWWRMSVQGAADKQTPTVTLARCINGHETVAARETYTKALGEWMKMEVRTSGTRIEGLIDGRALITAQCEGPGFGAIGLVAEGGKAVFDDVEVRPWQAEFSPASHPLAMWDTPDGKWRQVDANTAEGTGKALLPGVSAADARVSATVRLHQADAAGLYLRHDDTGGLLLAALVRGDSGLNARIFATDGSDGTVVAQAPVSGPADGWHEMTFSARGPLLAVVVDSERVISTVHAGPDIGRTGLYARGEGVAQFRDISAESIPDETELVDGLMPEFAGIIDRRTWASRPGAWHAQPEDLNRFWHSGYFPGPVALKTGIHPLGRDETTTHLYITEDRDVEAGYEVISHCRWKQGAVNVTLKAAGETVASASAEISPDKPYLLALNRDGGCVWAEVNGSLVAGAEDTLSARPLDELGISNEGARIVPGDLAVYTSWAKNYTFETAPCDWIRHSGTWEVTNRWSCSPNWTWFCGYNANGPAEVSSKPQFEGDLDLTFYVAARMMPRGNGKHYEQLRDIHIGACTGPDGAADGYEIRVGDDRNQNTAIFRRDKQVKQVPFRIPQIAIHNDWMQLGVRKRGATIQLLHWGHVIMEYTDPSPLDSGGISIGTSHNGIIIPRLTVYSQPHSG